MAPSSRPIGGFGVIFMLLRRMPRQRKQVRQGFSGHRLRAGFCTSAAEHGESIWKMMDVTRYKSVDTLRSYVRRADGFKPQYVGVTLCNWRLLADRCDKVTLPLWSSGEEYHGSG
jgi:hypothetical protein